MFTDVLVLTGSPGAGKRSSLVCALSNALRAQNKAHAVLDLDELVRVYPQPHTGFMWNNLSAVWPAYSRTSKKIILPVTLKREEDLKQLGRAIIPFSRLTVCELTADIEVIKERVTKREPTAEKFNTTNSAEPAGSSEPTAEKFNTTNSAEPNFMEQEKLEYHSKTSALSLADFSLATDANEDCVARIFERLGW